MRLVCAILVAILALAAAPQANACGPDSRCRIGDRHYFARMPADLAPDQRVGAIVFAHGYKGTGLGTMLNKRLRRVTAELGVALIGVKSAGPDWALPGAPRDTGNNRGVELEYFDAVIDDATSRFPIDPERIMVAGFSAGGMMVWTLVCHRSGLFAAFAPMAGTFWKPEPTTCDTPPANVLHIHGDADRTVPLKGRPIGKAHQGDVPQVIAMYTAYGLFGNAEQTNWNSMRCESRRNDTGQSFDYCLFKGRHRFSSNYVGMAWRHFVERGVL